MTQYRDLRGDEIVRLGEALRSDSPDPNLPDRRALVAMARDLNAWIRAQEFGGTPFRR